MEMIIGAREKCNSKKLMQWRMDNIRTYVPTVSKVCAFCLHPVYQEDFGEVLISHHNSPEECIGNVLSRHKTDKEGYNDTI